MPIPQVYTTNSKLIWPMEEPARVVKVLRTYGPSSIYGNNTLESLVCCIMSLPGDNHDCGLIAEIANVVNQQGRATTKRELFQYIEKLRSIIANYLPLMLPARPSFTLQQSLTTQKNTTSPEAAFLKACGFPVLKQLAKASENARVKLLNIWNSFSGRSLSLLAKESFDLFAELSEMDLDIENRRVLLKLWCEFSGSPLDPGNLLRLVSSNAFREWSNEELEPVFTLVGKIPEPPARCGLLSEWNTAEPTELVIPDVLRWRGRDNSYVLAAKSGHVYISGEDLGIVKFGTGKCGSICGSSLRRSIKGRFDEMAATNACLLVRKRSNKIHFLSLRDLTKIGSAVDDGIPKGKFTACGDTVYFVDEKEIQVFRLENFKFKYETKVAIDKSFYNPVDTTIISDGKIMYFIRQQKVKGVSLETGEEYGTEVTLNSDVKLMCFDKDTQTVVALDSADLVTVRSSVMQYENEVANQNVFIKLMGRCRGLIKTGMDLEGVMGILLRLFLNIEQFQCWEMLYSLVDLFLELLKFDISEAVDSTAVLKLLSCDHLERHLRIDLVGRMAYHPCFQTMFANEQFLSEILGFFSSDDLSLVFPGELSTSLINILLFNEKHAHFLFDCTKSSGNIGFLRNFFENVLVYTKRGELKSEFLVRLFEVVSNVDIDDIDSLLPCLLLAIPQLSSSWMLESQGFPLFVRILLKLVKFQSRSCVERYLRDSASNLTLLTGIVPVVLGEGSSAFHLRKKGCKTMEFSLSVFVRDARVLVYKDGSDTPFMTVESGGMFKVDTDDLKMELSLGVLPMTVNTTVTCITPFPRCYNPDYAQDYIHNLVPVLSSYSDHVFQASTPLSDALFWNVFQLLYGLFQCNQTKHRNAMTLIQNHDSYWMYLNENIYSHSRLSPVEAGSMVLFIVHDMPVAEIPREWQELALNYLGRIIEDEYKEIYNLDMVIRRLIDILSSESSGQAKLMKFTESLLEKPITSSLFYVNVLERLGRNIPDKMTKNLVLKCALSYTPELIPRLLFCVKSMDLRFSLRNVDTETIIKILRDIGGFVNDTHRLLDRSMPLAYFWRCLFDPSEYDGLENVLNSSDREAIAGILLILSVNYFGTQKGVFGHFNNRDCVVTGLELTSLCVVDKFGTTFNFPLLSTDSFVAIKAPFVIKTVPKIGRVSSHFVEIIRRISEDNDSTSFWAKLALCELSIANEVYSITKTTELVQSFKLPILRELKGLGREVFESGFHGNFKVVLRLPINHFCHFRIQNGSFGIIDAEEHSNWQSIEFQVDIDKRIPKGSDVQALLHGKDKQLVLKVNNKTYFTENYYGHLKNPSLYFLLESKDDITILPFCNLPSFLVPGVLNFGRTFSHVLVNDTLWKIVDWNKQTDKGLSYHLLPAVKPQNVEYLEFTASSSVTIRVLDGVSAYRTMFETDVCVTDKMTIGVAVDALHGVIHILTGAVLTEYVGPISAFTIKLETVSNDVFVFNVGQYPFEYASVLSDLKPTPSTHRKITSEMVTNELPLKVASISRKGDVTEILWAGATGMAEKTSRLTHFLDSASLGFYRFPRDSPLANMFFERILQKQKQVATAGMIVNSLSRSLRECGLAIETLEDFVVLAARHIETTGILDGKLSDEMKQLYLTLSEDFEKLNGFAMRAFNCLSSDKIEKKVVVAKCGDPSKTFSFLESDLIHVSADSPLRFSKIVIESSAGDSYVLNSSDYAQVSVRGSVLRIQNNETCSASVIPIQLQERDFAFGLGFVNFLIEQSDKDSRIADLLMRTVMIPLYDNLMNGKTLLFTNTYGHWFDAILRKRIVTVEQMKEINELTNFEALLQISDPDLGVPVTLFSAFCWSNCDSDLSIVRARIVEFVNHLTSPTSSGCASQTALHIGYKLLERTNTLNILGKVSELSLPVLTRLAFNAIVISEESEEITEVCVPPASEVFCREYRWADADQLFVCLGKCECPVELNHTRTKQDSILDGGHVAIELGSSDTQRQFWVTPLRPRNFVTVMDAQKILRVFQQFREMDDKCEAFCGAISSSLRNLVFKNSNPNISGYPDTAFTGLNMKADVDVIRFRIALHLLMLTRKSRNHQTRQSNPSLIEYLSSHGAYLGCGFTSSEESNNSYPGLFVPGTSAEIGNPSVLPHPEATSPDDLVEFNAFGKDLVRQISSGRKLAVPISRVVLRYVFGGDLIPDDFADVDYPFSMSSPTKEAMKAWLQPYFLQLESIRAGVVESGLIHGPPSRVFPRIIQMLPLLNHDDAILTPFFRLEERQQQLVNEY